MAQTDPLTPRQPLRLWPGVAAAVLLCVLRFVVPVLAPKALIWGVLGGLACALLIILWWLFFSRAPWSERLGAVALMIVAFFATKLIIHVSIATGMMGMMFTMYAIPALSLALVAGAVAGRRLPDRLRLAVMAAAILLACGMWTLLRTEGIFGKGGSQFAWRWSKTPEQRLLAQAGDEPAAPVQTPAAAAKPADWPGFRGPDRDGIARGVRIATDWSQSPPVQLWRRPIGPGWSSFAVRGDRFYTQEQRGDEEVVSCYGLTTGQPVWRHGDPVRFWESNGGAGPRATPTLGNGRVYTLGATGILNALDAGSGAAAWSRNVASETGTKVPMWGFAASPLVVDDLVIAAAAGKLVAYDLATGAPRWSGPAHGVSYSSPHRATLAGVAQVLLLSADGATSVAPADGKLLWEHKWEGFTIVQPALTADGDVLISTSGASGGLGIRRLRAAPGPGGWKIQQRWTSDGLSPYFNDYVVHQGHAYGFDGSTLACIDLEAGKRKWEGGSYGNGQLVLLPDQDLLLVVSEEGELALVKATPDRFTEIARFPALKGKTWNHPVVAGDVLLVRHGQEMAAFRLPPPRG
ncbi:MAG TPA: PQQ-binding-like beta-propeller repeat protein [Thermoanaerobaculia bacterium]|nr:PQQ-binding-like beta-propeller repeat protein [Thermoanaerobaculia bacterium]